MCGIECGTGPMVIKGWVFHAPSLGRVYSQEQQNAEQSRLFENIFKTKHNRLHKV